MKMMKRIITLIVCALWALALVPSWAQAEPGLPPRPTPVPLPTDIPEPPEGAWIQLRVHFAQGSALPWQELWTIVQWQDRQGDWQNVDGWQGTFDQATDSEGLKTWWVAARDFSKGPFRWAIYRERNGALLTSSELFNLPRAEAEMGRVEARLGN